MCVSLCVKFDVSSLTLTSFRPGGYGGWGGWGAEILPPTSENEPLESKLGLIKKLQF